MTTDKIKITMIHTSCSGSNNYYLYQAASEAMQHKYDIELLTSHEARYNRNLNNSDVYITTHGEHPSSNNKINIELWHGFPLKGMAKMDKQESSTNQEIENYWSRVDMIMSYSALYNTAMNACSGARIHQYHITGVPRNDALLTADARANLVKLIPEWQNVQDKVIFFMPTFRKSKITPEKHEGNKNFDNLFGVSDFNKNEWVQFLDDHRITLVMKLHPFEESYFTEELKEMSSSRILSINDGQLADANLDLYDVLGAADMLLTDYSSVYIDYLLLDRPIAFLPTDLEDYSGNRGLLFEPYDFWTPGPKSYTQDQLLKTIAQYLEHPDWYKQERRTIRELCHKHQDAQSASRIWTMIDQYIEEHKQLIMERRAVTREHQQMQQAVKEKIQEIIALGDIAKADLAIKQYLEANDPDPDIFSMNGMLHLLNHDPEEALNAFHTGHIHFPWDEDLLYNIGYVYESVGQIEAALPYYEQSLQQSIRPELTVLLKDKIASLHSQLGRRL